MNVHPATPHGFKYSLACCFYAHHLCRTTDGGCRCHCHPKQAYVKMT